MVCLVILTIMTFLGLNSMTDSGLQAAMVRNNQLRLMAYNTALSEINAQLEDIESNINTTTLLDAHGSPDGTREYEFVEILLSPLNHPFTQTLTTTYLYEGPVPEYELGDYVAWHFELESDAVLEGTGTRSDQAQGFYYVAPNN